MAFCSKCGAVVLDGSSFCEVCGQAIDTDRILGSSHLSPHPATKEESIHLCNILLSNPPRYWLFRFYWPTFIVAAVACFVTTFVFAALIAASGSDAIELAEAPGYLSIPITLLIGIPIAKARQNRANEKLAQNDMMTTARANQIRAQIEDMKRKQSELSEELQDYKELIPKNSIIKIKRALDLSQAQTIEEAVEIVKNPRGFKGHS